jgi:hypothetical protein
MEWMPPPDGIAMRRCCDSKPTRDASTPVAACSGGPLASSETLIEKLSDAVLSTICTPPLLLEGREC